MVYKIEKWTTESGLEFSNELDALEQEVVERIRDIFFDLEARRIVNPLEKFLAFIIQSHNAEMIINTLTELQKIREIQHKQQDDAVPF